MILEDLIAEDFGIEGSGRWKRSKVHSSLVIDCEKGIFFFNKEGIIGDALIYLTKVRLLSFEAAKEILSRTDYKETYVYNLDTKQGDVIVYPKLVDIFWEEGKTNREYWYNRGITDSTIDRFQLGCYLGFYSIPIFFQGTFRNFQMRKDNPKTIRPYYKGLGTLPFNFDVLKLTDMIVIAEGPTDCIRLNQEGIPCVSQTGGSENWKGEWNGLLANQKLIYINYDNDEAGINGAKKLAKHLGEFRCKLYNFQFKGPEYKGYDIIDFFRDGYTKQNYLELLEGESKYVFELEDYGTNRSRNKKFLY
jgi:DNA primase